MIEQKQIEKIATILCMQENPKQRSCKNCAAYEENVELLEGCSYLNRAKQIYNAGFQDVRTVKKETSKDIISIINKYINNIPFDNPAEENSIRTNIGIIIDYINYYIDSIGDIYENY